MIILLMGFLGAGKSSIGLLIAKELGLEFIEHDDYTLEKTNFSSVAEAYKENIDEWKKKQLESSAELSKKENTVVVTNGVLIENKENLKYFKENADDLKVIYIKSNPEVLTQRLVSLYDEFRKNGPRSVLKAMEKHFKRRDSLYKENADLIINTEDSTPEEASQDLLQKLKN